MAWVYREYQPENNRERRGKGRRKKTEKTLPPAYGVGDEVYWRRSGGSFGDRDGPGIISKVILVEDGRPQYNISDANGVKLLEEVCEEDISF